MKKKPPPGATLIARLREQRLAREQSLKPVEAGEVVDVPQAESVESQQGAGGFSVAAEAGDDSLKRGKARKAEIVPVEKGSGALVRAPGTGIIPVAEGGAGTGSPAVSPEKDSARVMRREGAIDLIHRQIDIDDLRPTTDDYFQLTDEIRLAGRFAAVGLIAQGLRLARIKDENIYKDHYQTFDEYCRKEHQMSATYAYRLMRMAEMAEKVAELGMRSHGLPQSMPDPFEVMIGLGHRHLMALLPLEVETAEDLLLRGVPVAAATEGAGERVPIGRATERQIREALKVIAPSSKPASVVRPEKKAPASEKQLIPALGKLVEMLEDWATWLGGDVPPEVTSARTQRGPLLNKLAKRFRIASQRIADALEQAD